MVLKKIAGNWALVSKKNPKKILKWFGSTKPSEEMVAKEEKRVNIFKQGWHGDSGGHSKAAKGLKSKIFSSVPKDSHGKVPERFAKFRKKKGLRMM